MKRMSLCTFFCCGLLMGSCGLDAFTAHACLSEEIPSLVASYTILDLGESDIDALHLSRRSKKLSLAPRLNNQGVIIGNTGKGGFVTLPGHWMFAPQHQGMKINFHGLSDEGDLLVALLRGHESVEWMLWPCEEGNYGTLRQHIKTIDPFVDKFYVTGFSEGSTMTAYERAADCSLQPLTWDPCHGMSRLGVREALDIKGAAYAISRGGTVAGIFDCKADQAPFVWSSACGLLVANNYRKHFNPTGWVEFADLLVTDDSTVYGTYSIKHLAENYVIRGHYYESRQDNGSYYGYNAFSWSPSEGQIAMLDLNGMRLSAVNSAHILVGSLLSQAALALPGQKPAPLASFMQPDEAKDWKLLEITDINDQGQVVGYGWYQDKMHLFLANPLK